MNLHSLKDRLNRQPASHKRKYHYTFQETLGAGAFGVVRRAVNNDTHEAVAVKVILKRKLKDQRDIDAISEEFRILSKLSHPNIVEFKEWFASKEKFYMVTQLCLGGELFDKIVEKGSFTESDACVVFSALVGAVQYLHHRNIVHRDIKPENLLYASKDPDSRLMLCDFGVAHELISSEELIMEAAGSLGYAAPEIFTGEGHSKPVDVWSLGVVLYTILSGLSPFEAQSSEQFLEEVTPGFRPYFHEKYFQHVSEAAKSLITKMLVYDQNMRITIDETASDPWILHAASTKHIDLLPTVRPSLAARKKWRAVVQRVLLAKMIEDLRVDDDNNDDFGDSDGFTVSASETEDESDDDEELRKDKEGSDTVKQLPRKPSASGHSRRRSKSHSSGQSDSSNQRPGHRRLSSSLKDGSRFMQVVLAAAAQAENEKAIVSDKESDQSSSSQNLTNRESGDSKTSSDSKTS